MARCDRPDRSPEPAGGFPPQSPASNRAPPGRSAKPGREAAPAGPSTQARATALRWLREYPALPRHSKRKLPTAVLAGAAVPVLVVAPASAWLSTVGNPPPAAAKVKC